MSDKGQNGRDRMQMIQSSQCRRTNIESMESATRALGLNMSFHSISRQKDQNIEDHHIDEVIKYYWCWGNSEKIKDENFNLFVFSFARVSTLSLSVALSSRFAWHESWHGVGTVLIMSLSLCFSVIFPLVFTLLPDWIFLRACAHRFSIGSFLAHTATWNRIEVVVVVEV